MFLCNFSSFLSVLIRNRGFCFSLFQRYLICFVHNYWQVHYFIFIAYCITKIKILTIIKKSDKMFYNLGNTIWITFKVCGILYNMFCCIKKFFPHKLDCRIYFKEVVDKDVHFRYFVD